MNVTETSVPASFPGRYKGRVTDPRSHSRTERSDMTSNPSRRQVHDRAMPAPPQLQPPRPGENYSITFRLGSAQFPSDEGGPISAPRWCISFEFPSTARIMPTPKVRGPHGFPDTTWELRYHQDGESLRAGIAQRPRASPVIGRQQPVPPTRPEEDGSLGRSSTIPGSVRGRNDVRSTGAYPDAHDRRPQLVRALVPVGPGRPAAPWRQAMLPEVRAGLWRLIRSHR